MIYKLQIANIQTLPKISNFNSRNFRFAQFKKYNKSEKKNTFFIRAPHFSLQERECNG
jgi:hypothetical protein